MHKCIKNDLYIKGVMYSVHLNMVLHETSISAHTVWVMCFYNAGTDIQILMFWVP